jgi:hypothetical protein
MYKLLSSRGVSMSALTLALFVPAAPIWSQAVKTDQRVIIRSSGSHDHLRHIKGKLGADGNIIPNSKQEENFDFKLFLQ